MTIRRNSALDYTDRRRLPVPPIALLVAICGSLALCQRSTAAEKIAPAVYHRIAFLGDSITDGDTYPKLVRDALASAGLPKMVAINAGIGGDTARGMHARLERDVLAFHPTLVTLSAGANDAGSVSPEAYERDVRGIAERLKQEHIPLILLMPNIVGPKFANKQKDLDAYEAILRQIAKEYGLRVAEVNLRQKQDAAAGHSQLAPDDIHPNWEGQKMIARAVLDAVGYSEVKVPDSIANSPLPGVIPQWKVRLIGPKEPALTEAAMTHVKVDNSWMTLKLPETEPLDDLDSNDRWFDGYRAQGASVALRRQPPGRYLGITSISSDKSKSVQFHTGGDLEQVWLNGKSIYQNNSIRGYHIGRESVAAELKPSENVVVIRTGPVFFLSVTDGLMWEETRKEHGP
jgi:lysophospholipase L1-like esterase